MAGREDWERLGTRITAARVALGMHTREDLAKATGFSARMLGDLERGRRDNYDQATLIRIEQALGWQPGSVDAILAGGEPTRSGPGDGHDAVDDDFADLEIQVRVILGWDLPDPVKQKLITEAWQFREQQLAEKRKFEGQQAAKRRRWINDWINRAHEADSPAT